MTRADRMMADWLAEVDDVVGATVRPEDHDDARAWMQKTLAYQAATFLDALENLAMLLLRPFGVGKG
jgi:hypothetical protein